MSRYPHPDLNDVALTTLLRALADPVRLDLVRQLHLLGEANCATLIGNRAKSSMSHHFQVLRDSGLIRTEVRGVSHCNKLRRAELDTRFPGLMEAVLARGPA